MKKIKLKIEGMHCNSCAHLIESELKNRVEKISVKFSDEKAEIEFDENKISEKEIIEEIKRLGYEANVEEEKEVEEVEEVEEEPEEEEDEINEAEEQETNGKKRKSNTIGWIFVILGLVFFLFLIYYLILGGIKLPEINIPQIGDKAGLLLLFAAGILTGFHCISMCGGFVLSYTGKNAINGHKGFKQHLVYGGSKVVSYTIIGGIFGLIGGIVAFSIGLRGWVAILAGVFMIFYSLSMFGVKFFRKFQFNPKFLTKIASSESSKFKGAYSRPLVTGLLNGLFIACGPLQAMYLYAMGTGSFFSGATSLMAFGLGTLPVMLGFGSLATIISHNTTKKILKISAVIVLILGLIMLNRGLTLTGSSLSYDSIKSRISSPNTNVLSENTAPLVNGVQEINMQVDASGYSPNSFVLKKGFPVKWNINVKQLTGCNSELVFRQYGIDIKLKQGLNTAEFTPDKAGTYTFSCGMGMLKGSFIVTETGTASQQEIKAATPSSGGSCGMGAGGGSCGCGG